MAFDFDQGGGDDGGRMMADINVTPLVDVMLVLLIIFMVTAPLLQQGLQVNLPQTRASSMPGDDTTLIVTIDKDLKLFLLKEEITRPGLSEKLKAIVAQNPDKEVFLKADAAVPYGEVIKVMGTIRGSGVVKLGMVTQPGDEDEE